MTPKSVHRFSGKIMDKIIMLPRESASTHCGIPLPGRDDAIGRAAAQALEHLRQPLTESLRHSVGSFLNVDNEDSTS